MCPGGPYHPGPCRPSDHACVDGLACSPSGAGLACTNSNQDDDGSTVVSFHSRNYCPGPDLRHDWPGSHQEANFSNPASTARASPNDGFVLVNDGATPLVPPLVPDGIGQHSPDSAAESPTDDDTMGYYDQTDLPFYYGLAQTYAISDRYFSSVIGPTFPNRSYELAATSFGHVTTAEILPPLVPPPGGYEPITGTIMDLLDDNRVSWANYFADVPTTAIFRGFDFSRTVPVTALFAIAGPSTCTLPAVSFVDPAFEQCARDQSHPDRVRRASALGHPERAVLRFSDRQRGAKQPMLAGLDHLHHLGRARWLLRSCAAAEGEAGWRTEPRRDQSRPVR